MDKTVVIHQPEFLPYLGFFHRLLYCDVFVILDDVQYEGFNFQNRNRIKTREGVKWLSESLEKHPLNTPIRDIRLSKDVDWRTKHLNKITNNYRKAKYFDEVLPIIENIYSNDSDKLLDFNMKAIELLNAALGICAKTIYSSELSVKGKKNELVVDIMKKVEANTHLCGAGARKYFDPKPFEQNGLQIVWQEFRHPVYPQLHGAFIPYLSSIDLLFNCGVEDSGRILRMI